MSLSHNQMAYAAILSTMMFGAMFVGVSGYMQTDSDIGGYEDQSEGSLDPGDQFCTVARLRNSFSDDSGSFQKKIFKI